MTGQDKIGHFLFVFVIMVTGATAMADLGVRIDAQTSDGQWPVNLPFSLGYTFTVEARTQVTHLGRFDIKGTGLADDALARLYNWDTGEPLGETTIRPSSLLEVSGRFDCYFEAIDPVILEPGTTYLLAVEVGPGDFYFDQTAPVATFADGIIHGVGKATPVGSPAMPARADTSTFTISNGQDTYYGPNLKTLPVPADEGPRALDTHTAVEIVDTFKSRRPPADDVALGFAGYVFTTESEILVTHLGSFDIKRDGLEQAVQVRLLAWDTGEILADTLVPISSEVLITAGQSNAVNYGSPALTPQDDRISAWTGSAWRHAGDPQPIATGTGGSPWSCLGDMLVADLDMPIGFVSVAVGATRVDQWVPGAQYYFRITSPILTFSLASKALARFPGVVLILG